MTDEEETKAEDTRKILFEMGKDAILISCRLFPENAGELAQNLLKMHKELYPEIYSKPPPSSSEEKESDPPPPKNETIRFPPGYDPTANYPPADEITKTLARLLKKRKK